MKERIILAGSSGFIGRHLTKAYTDSGYEVIPLNRRGAGLQWDGKTVGPWAEALEGAKAIVNLAGAPINGRWTESYKKELADSRIFPTRAIAEAIKACSKPPQFWVNGSAVGFYGDQVFSPVDESGPAGTDFLADLCVKWEAEALQSGAPTKIRVIRTGFVLGSDGGALPLLMKLTRAFLGSAVGDGKQVMGWIHIQDLCHLFVAATQDPAWPAVVNGTAPTPVTNAEMMSVLRRVVGRPWVPGPPAFLMKTVTSITGEAAPLLALASQNALPKAALEAGFRFQHPLIEEAVRDLLRG